MTTKFFYNPLEEDTMPGTNKNDETNRNINPPNREESGMRGKPTGSWDEEEELDYMGGSSGNKGDTGTRKGNSGNTGSSGGRSGGSSGSK
jgi:hypothetical protein